MDDFERIGSYDATGATVGSIKGTKVILNVNSVKNSLVHAILEGPATPSDVDIKVTILSPQLDERFCFNDSNPGKFIINLKAEVQPQEYADQLLWSTEKINGTQITFDPPSARGPVVQITYKVFLP